MAIFTDELAELVGQQRPRICTVPEQQGDTELYDRAIDMLGGCGLELDEWQRFWLRHSLDQRPDGKWSAQEVGGNVGRQNGKGSELVARQIVGLFLVPTDRLIIHSAHQFDTSLEHFRRLLETIEDNPALHKQIKPRGISWSHGSEGIELRDGSRIRFRTRGKGGAGGRGFTGDLMVLDEAMILPEAAFGNLLPTLSARPNPQIWYTGTAVDQEIHADGVVFARVRERGVSGSDDRLLYLEWSVEADDPDSVPEEVLDDPQAWAVANPALGIRISPEFVQMERRALASRTFAVERLGVGDWPPTGPSSVLDMAAWAALTDGQSEPNDPLVFSIDVSPDRAWGSIAVAGLRDDGHTHLDVGERHKGTDWIVKRAGELAEKHPTAAWWLDERGPAGSLVPGLKLKGIEPNVVTAQDMAQACGMFEDAVTAQTIRHMGQPLLASAIRGAAKRALGDAFAWSRRGSGVDISPLVAVTLAHFGLQKTEPPAAPSFGVL